MTGIYLAADQTDKKMWHTLPSILSRSFRTAWAGSNVAGNTQLLLDKAGALPATRLKTAVLICKEVASVPLEIPEDCQTIAVVYSDGGEELLSRVSRTRLPAITCGLSARDTLTLSSIRAENAVLSIQRTLTCFDQRSIEPQEIPLQLCSAIDSFTLTAAAAIFLLTGHKHLLAGARFGLDLPPLQRENSHELPLI